MPLSIDGLSHQIASSLLTYKIKKLGTVNDCKVVLNHLIRKFSEPLSKEGRQKYYHSINISKGTRIIKDHLIPVNVIMNHFLDLKITSEVQLAGYIKDYLSKQLIIVSITEHENAALNSNGYQREMPKEYKLNNDIWARYKCSKIYENIEKTIIPTEVEWTNPNQIDLAKGCGVIYFIRIVDGLGKEYQYIGQTKRCKNRLTEYKNNIRRIFKGQPRRISKGQEKYRPVHLALAKACEYGWNYDFYPLENISLEEINKVEQARILELGCNLNVKWSWAVEDYQELSLSEIPQAF